MAFATGAAVMTVELMGVRLMAPWFGQSQIVWTNVIGVVLLALALGQWLGGRWCESGRGRGPGALLAGAGALCLALPGAVELVSGWILPRDLALAEAAGFVAWGSLLATILALGVPMLALGAVTPWLVRLARGSSRWPGGVSGQILAAGTLGSLAGTFGSTYVLLPAWGSALAVQVAGAVLGVLGLVVARWTRGGVGAWWWLWLAPLAMALSGRAEPREPTLAEMETAYQWARIVEDDDGRRLLRLNEGLDSFHSALWPGHVETGLYFDAFVLPALLAPSDELGHRRVLVVGMGGGTMARLIHAADAAARVTGVEIDPALVDLGREWLGLQEDMADVLVLDGRMALRGLDGRQGAILLDAFSDQIYVPHHMATVEFFELVRKRLLPNGVLAANLGGVTREDPVVRALAATIGEVFAEVEMARVPGTRNWLLMAWNGARPSPQARRQALAGTIFEESLAWTWQGDGDATRFAAGPSAGAGTRILRDGNAPVEALAHAAWQVR